MRQVDTITAKRWWMRLLAGITILAGLALTAPRDSHAQMRYSGGFIPTHHQRPNPPLPGSPPPPASAPLGPLSYSPDNDGAYTAFYPGAAFQRKQAAGAFPSGVIPADLPWNPADFEEYTETPAIPQDASLFQPKKYLLTATSLPPAPPAERSPNALLMAHLPEHAALWVEGTRTRSLGSTRYFQSPPLQPGRKYNYRVRVAWIEDGRWVSETRMVPVQAGLIQAIYLRLSPKQ